MAMTDRMHEETATQQVDAIAVLGSGSWGTALAVHLGKCGHQVRLWARDPSLAAEMSAGRTNPRYLTDVGLPQAVTPTASIEAAVRGANFIIAAVPSHGMRQVIRRAARDLDPDATVVSAAKGLEEQTLLRMSQVIAQELGESRPVAVLSGPSFALEVARRLPTAVVVASADAAVATAVQQAFRGPALRLYSSPDVPGVEIGGALKNVIAIGAGVVDGLGLGHNALAALITRGLAEITRLACAAGGRRDTLAGLSGLGDLVLTCTGQLSRNRHVGLELGRGRSLPEILGGMRMVAEGVKTTGAALALGAAYDVELPIAAQMAEVLAGRQSPQHAVEDLMLRRQRTEE
ncbi:MAG: NAD(P)-dependent glycerol-3-phosphate dehydrogenase [Acidobacteria bacterium]|nr:NAD(P)-dependent glycerol-3-phosphate dehydrogenase [Acidobacteriota bacterium]